MKQNPTRFYPRRGGSETVAGSRLTVEPGLLNPHEAIYVHPAGYAFTSQQEAHKFCIKREQDRLKVITAPAAVPDPEPAPLSVPDHVAPVTFRRI